jgi:hypothetical protein
MPNIPGPVLSSFAAVALADGRAMVLGGNASNSIGTGPFTAETWILNPRSRTWSSGPPMLEARAGATATRLTDGSVLVVGGWTPRNDWQSNEASRSTERWRPGEAVFAAGLPLPGPAAHHKAQWLGEIAGTTLLIGGGYTSAWSPNAALYAFDVSRDE